MSPEFMAVLNGKPTVFSIVEDYNCGGLSGEWSLTGKGLAKIEATGFWAREYENGRLKSAAPTLGEILAIARGEAATAKTTPPATAAEPPKPLAASSWPSLVPTGAAPAAPAAKAAPTSDIFSPDELAAEINRKFGRR